MRKLFSRQLIEARHEMLSIYEAVDLALHDAVKAYVTDDRKLATKTKKRTLSIDARCANLEAVCYNLIATQSPVASDFRLLQTIIYVDFNLQRMTDKVRQICRATRHMIMADISLPKELVGTVEAEAEAVYQVLGSSLSALVTNDMSIICNLAVEDEPVHAAYEKFFRTFNRMDTGDFMDDDSNYDDLRRAIMVSRYGSAFPDRTSGTGGVSEKCEKSVCALCSGGAGSEKELPLLPVTCLRTRGTRLDPGLLYLYG